MAEEGIRSAGRALPAIRADTGDLEARGEALYGAWLCGIVLGNVGMALHHKLCHTLGGSFNLPHAEMHTIVLPHALAYNAKRRRRRPCSASRARSRGRSAAQAVFELARDNGAPIALCDIGMEGGGTRRDIAWQNQYPNPRPLERGAIRLLLQDAFEGKRPSV